MVIWELGRLLMFIDEEYYFWRLTADLMINQEFELLKIDEVNKEVWLEKLIGNTSHVVRIYHHTFDWANHLKQDIADVLQRVKSIKKLLVGRNIRVYSVYISEYTPVDDWDELKPTLKLKDRKSVHLDVHYLDTNNRDQEVNHFLKRFTDKPSPIIPPEDNTEKSNMIQYLKQAIISNHQKSQQKAQSIFQYGKPLITYILIAINVLVFFLVEFNGGSTSTLNLIEYGAKYNPYMLDGQWWRMVTSMFLHIGYLHIMMNMLALYYLGIAVEGIYGSSRFLIIYLLAGLTGAAASFAFNPQVSAGASGAIFGLFGALLFFGIIHKKLFFKTMGKNVLVILGINLVFSFTVPVVDVGAHIGGLVGGFLASMFVHLPKNKQIGKQVIGFVLYAVLFAGLLTTGILNDKIHYNSAIQLGIAQELVQKENYTEASKVLTKTIKNTDDNQSHLYFYRSYIFIKQGKLHQALVDLKEVIKLDPSYAEAHFNLALVYYDLNDQEKALDEAEKAKKLKPNDSDFKNLVDKLRNSGNILD